MAKSERNVAIDAFNAHFFDEYTKTPGGVPFQKLIRGVEMVTGMAVIDPEEAIPKSYRGDGSYTMLWRDMNGKTFSQREWLPWIWPDDDLWKPYFHDLYQHSRPFREAHHGLYRARVDLEAYYDAMFGKALGRRITDTRYWEAAEWDLRTRREVVFPLADGLSATLLMGTMAG